MNVENLTKQLKFYFDGILLIFDWSTEIKYQLT